MPELKQERPLSELFGDLANEIGTLIRQEVSLAKIEISEKAASVGKQVLKLAVGGAIAYAAFLTAIATLVILFALMIPWWAAALVIAVVVGIVGTALVQNALSTLKQIDLTPTRTVRTLKEDAQWAKAQMK